MDAQALINPVEVSILTEQELIASAKSTIADHEKRVEEGDLANITSNMADDVVLLAANMPLVLGLESCKFWYQEILTMGTWHFRHHYDGADAVGDTVQLYGIAKGELTPHVGEIEEFANNFIITTKQIDGRMRIWRAAFAPAS